MPDQNGRPILPRQHTLRRSDRFRQRCQRILHGRCIESRRLQSRNHLGPARPVGEEAVYKHDVTSFRFDLCMTGVRDKGSRGDNHHGYDAATIHNISPANPTLSCSLRSSVRSLCAAKSRYWETMAYFAAVAAFSINAATSRGCERKIAWLPGSSMTCDWARFAMKRSRSGLIIRSCLEITA